jgi:hypothetical protein
MLVAHRPQQRRLRAGQGGRGDDMAQIIGQVTHDITRRIEETGQYHF